MHPSRLQTGGVLRIPLSISLLAASVALVGGCDTKSWIDPSEVGRMQREPLAVPILSTVDPAVESGNDQFASAADPTADDYKSVSSDYTVGANDTLQISISDLQGPGQETVKTARVSNSGNISLPYINSLHAAGLTEIELEQAIVDAYRSANLIQNAQVQVAVVQPRGRTFSILGAVVAPGQYEIVDANFRVYNALVEAKDVINSGADIPFMYIVRDTTPRDTGAHSGTHAAPATTPATTPAPGADDLKPKSELPHHGPAVALAQPVVHLLADAPADPAAPPAPAPAASRSCSAPGARAHHASPGRCDRTAAPAPTTPPPPTAPPADATTPPVAPAPAPTAAAPSPAPNAGFEFNAPATEDNTRVIRIPLSALRAGDLRYNIPVRANDLIIVPVPEAGEFYMGGHVQRPGVFTLTGRKITLKEAIVSAGMFDGLAIPQRTDIIRRVKPDHEIFVRVDLAKIFAGEQPDIFLRPYDQIQVGTNALAPFIAAARGAFRITYGFGFLYDRNFSTSNNNGTGF